MSHTPLEDYALLTNRATAALVSRDGSIDWWCPPRFDSPAVFAKLLGSQDNGHWLLRIADAEVVERAYLPDTFVLQTRWRGEHGEAVVTELLQEVSDGHHTLQRNVEVVSGEVLVHQELRMRPNYGERLPWVRRRAIGEVEVLVGISGPTGLVLRGPLPHAHDAAHTSQHRLAAGTKETWTLTWFPSHEVPPVQEDPDVDLARTVKDWRDWAATMVNADDPAVRRSLLVLRGLTHYATGGVIAAPTASLPEEFGGIRNWDYRFVWLRDSALSIEAMIAYGLAEHSWRDWLLRAIAGDVHDPKIMYRIDGAYVETELELSHLSGYEDSVPVRIGNGAADQYQADVVGEVMIALQRFREAEVAEDPNSWALQRALLDYCERRIDDKDQGIWEMRGEEHYFTHGRVMLWAAFDCGVRAVETQELPGPVERWRGLRDRLRTEIEERGWNAEIDSFTQTYGSAEVDASLLMIPHTGFCAWDDPRVLGTVARIERDLVDDHGLLHRYRTQAKLDGLAGDEYPFLLCCFWLVESYARTGQLERAEQLYEQLVSYGGELDLLAEEYSPAHGRLAGNYPQAFSHLGLVQAAEAIRESRAGR